MPRDKYLRLLKFTRIILVAIPIIILLFVFNKRFVPFGQLTETYSFKKPAVIVSAHYPKNNVEDIEKNIKTKKFYQRLSKNPVYFDVTLPFAAEFADVEVEYQNPEAPIVQFGVKQKEKGAGEYLLETVENKCLENSDWYREEDKEKGIIFLQKPKLKETENGNKENDLTKEEGSEEKESQTIDEEEPKEYVKEYASYDDFVKNLPKDKTVAFYQFDSNQYYQIKDYQPQNSETIFEKTLRGSHEIVTYVENENLDFTFYYQKRQKSKSKDSFSVKVFRGEKLVEEFLSENDKDLESDSLKIFLKNSVRGIYNLKIETGTNTQIKKIITRQKYWAFLNRLSLDNTNESSYFYLDSNLVFKTSHQPGLQTVRIDREWLKIDKLNKYFGPKAKEGIRDVFMPISDINLEFQGLAAVTSEPLDKLTPDFQFRAVNLEDNLPHCDGEYDFIVAKYYEPAKEVDGWKTLKKSFSIDGLWLKNKKLNFMISIPGLSNYQEVKIGKIKVTLKK